MGANPLLVDPDRIGVLYAGTMRIAADPYSGASGDNFETNRVDLRFEANVLLHVRTNTGAWIVSPGS